MMAGNVDVVHWCSSVQVQTSTRNFTSFFSGFMSFTVCGINVSLRNDDFRCRTVLTSENLNSFRQTLNVKQHSMIPCHSSTVQDFSSDLNGIINSTFGQNPKCEFNVSFCSVYIQDWYSLESTSYVTNLYRIA
jgi:hypothetical protein